MAVKNGAIPLSVEGIRRALQEGKSEEARRRYIESLRQEVERYERRYRIPSAAVRHALKNKKIRETLGVIEWVDAYETLLSLSNGRQARLERSRRIPSRSPTRAR